MIGKAIVNLLTELETGASIHAGGESIKVTGANPRIFYTATGGERRHTDDGPDRLTRGVYQLDIFASLPSAAEAIAAAILELDDYAGEVEETEILRIYFPEPPRSGPAQRLSGEAAGVARVILDMEIEYRESTP